MDHLHHFVKQHGLLTTGSLKKTLRSLESSTLRSPKLVSQRHAPFSDHTPNPTGEAKNAMIQPSLTPDIPTDLDLFRIDSQNSRDEIELHLM